MTGYLRLAYQT
uniref:Uncharacterized protein n=1 Tax=Rhizophora mucronata TaxID=61149 RepID=A0A2P2JX50_RHIMU